MAKRPTTEDEVPGTPPRWPERPPRWESAEQAVEVATNFLTAARHLIVLGKPTWEWTEAELLGMRIVTDLQLCFQSGAPEEWTDLLRQVLEVLRGEPSFARRRYYSVRAVVDWGRRWREADWQRDDATRKLLLDQFVSELALHDEAFSTLKGAPQALVACLDAFDPEPGGKRGSKSAERLLAELIALELDSNGALGLSALDNEADEDAAERIRKALTRDVGKIQASLRAASK